MHSIFEPLRKREHPKEPKDWMQEFMSPGRKVTGIRVKDVGEEHFRLIVVGGSDHAAGELDQTAAPSSETAAQGDDVDGAANDDEPIEDDHHDEERERLEPAAAAGEASDQDDDDDGQHR
jgi:hypothetical protein